MILCWYIDDSVVSISTSYLFIKIFEGCLKFFGNNTQPSVSQNSLLSTTELHWWCGRRSRNGRSWRNGGSWRSWRNGGGWRSRRNGGGRRSRRRQQEPAEHATNLPAPAVVVAANVAGAFAVATEQDVTVGAEEDAN